MRGDHGRAGTHFQRALTGYEELGDKVGVAKGLNNIGIVHRRRGDSSLALDHQLRALAIEETLGDKASIAGSLNNIGLAYVDLGDYARASDYFRKGLRVAQEIDSAHETANLLNNMGIAYRRQGAYPQALEAHGEALKYREAMGDKWGTAFGLSAVAQVHLNSGHHERAAEYASRAADLAREGGLRDALGDALTTLGSARRALGQTAAAREAWEEAVATIEDLRGRLGGGEAQGQRAFEARVSPYYGLLELFAEGGGVNQALLYAERGKARVLFDVLRSGRVNVTKEMTGPERSEEQRLSRAHSALNAAVARETRSAKPDASRLAELQARLEQARLQLLEFQSKLYAAHPLLQARRGEQPVFRGEEAELLLPDAETALLEYAVGEDASYLFTLTRASTGTGAVSRVHRIPIPRDRLRALAEDLRHRMASRDLAVTEAARRAHALLLGPARAELAGKSRLVIVPDGVLWEVPFQALVTRAGRFVIEETAVSYAPSLTVLREMVSRRRRSAAPGALLGLGNPALGGRGGAARFAHPDDRLSPLPEAEREVSTLAELYGAAASRVLIGPSAREETVKAEAGRFRVLHFATHAVVDNAAPMYSRLVLAQDRAGEDEDGLLEAWELMKLDLAADLVVLSACETGRGRVGNGEGIIGLSWALFVAGSPAVVASQWKVESASTAKLMLAFHRNVRGDATRAGALRSAALGLLRTKAHRHPFYWAGFQVVGDGS